MDEPYPPNFGLSSNGQPNSKFRAFLKSKRSQEIAIRTAQEMFKHCRVYLDTLSKCIECSNVCTGSIYYIARSKSKKLEFQSAFDSTLRKSKVSILDRGAITKMESWNANQFTRMRTCRKKRIILTLILVVPRTSETVKMFGEASFSADGDFFAHAALSIIDVSSKGNIVTIIDPSLTRSSSYQTMVKAIGDGIARDVGAWNSKRTKVNILGDDLYGNLQGRSDLCAPWAVYVLTLVMINNQSMSTIYRRLHQESQQERDNRILRFLFHLSTNKSVARFRKDAVESFE